MIVGLCVFATIGLMALQYRVGLAHKAAMVSANRIANLLADGRLEEAKRGIMSSDAIDSLNKEFGGERSGVAPRVDFETCQASGLPCLVILRDSKHSANGAARLYFYDRYCVSAAPVDRGK